jgi:hypothetical protein
MDVIKDVDVYKIVDYANRELLKDTIMANYVNDYVAKEKHWGLTNTKETS